MANQQLTLLPQDRVVQRFIKRYREAMKFAAESSNSRELRRFADGAYCETVVACFGDCFNLTFADAERYLKEHSP